VALLNPKGNPKPKTRVHPVAASRSFPLLYSTTSKTGYQTSISIFCFGYSIEK
jgi:hypothetical protein